MTMQVEFVSPEELVWSGEGTSVLARTLGGGDIAWLTGHAPFLGALDTCVIRIQLTDGSEERIAVKGGFVEVSHNHVKILSDQAERPEHVDPDEARAALAAAEDALARLQALGEDAGPTALADAGDEVRWHKLRLEAGGHGATTAATH